MKSKESNTEVNADATTSKPSKPERRWVIGGATAITSVLATKWSTPKLSFVITPAHAQTSNDIGPAINVTINRTIVII